MKKNLFCLLTAFTLLIFGCRKQKPTAILPNGKTVENTVGFTTAAGFYAFDPALSSLEEGADQVLALGSRVVKLWLTADPGAVYTYNVDWSKRPVRNCVDILKTDYYSAVLKKDFHTIILETHTFDTAQPKPHIYWQDGMTPEECERTRSEMYDVASYLMTEYAGTGKTFLLQNWEGDNMLGNEKWLYDPQNDRYYYRESGPEGAAAEADSLIRTTIRGMIDWCNARQQGVDSARNRHKESDVRVLHVLEANFTRADSLDAYYEGHPLLITPWVYENTPMVINTVVPFTDCDLYSLSCWGATSVARANTMQARLEQFESCIGESYTDLYDGNRKKSRRPMSRPGQKTKLMLGEYGAAERAQSGDRAWKYADTLDYNTARRQREVIQIQTDIALKHGLEYIVYWQLYCNDPRTDIDRGITRQQAIAGVRATNDQLKGYWVIRADGSPTETARYFRGLLDPTSLHLSEPLIPGKVYSVPDTCGGFEIRAELLSAERPSNLSGAWKYDDRIKVYGSPDGENFTEVPLIGFYTHCAPDPDGFRSDLVYVNREPPGCPLRYFRMEEHGSGDPIQWKQIQLYRN